MRRLLAPLHVVLLPAAALGAAAPAPASAGDDEPAAPGAADAKGDPRDLPDGEKAKRLAEIERTWEDHRRNQDLVPVRTRRNGVVAAGDLRFPPAAKFLKKVFDDDRDVRTRVAAMIAIGKAGDAATIESAVKRALASAKDEPVFAANLPRMFASVEDLASREWIATRLEGVRDDVVGASVVEAVGEARLAAAVPALVEVLGKSRDPAVRFEALRAIGRAGRTQAVSLLLPYLSDRDWRLRMAAAEGLGYAGEPLAIPEVRRLVVRGEEAIVVETAIEAVARLGTREAFEPLVDGLRVGRLRARQKAREALRGLAKSEFGHEKDYGVDPNGWAGYWAKVKRGADPDDPSFAAKETASYFSFPIHSDRVLFILDVSGSMQWPDAPRDSGIRPSDWRGRRIDLAHRELFKALRALAQQNQGRIPKRKQGDTGDLPWAPSEDGAEPPTLFNLATFAGSVAAWRPAQVLATKELAEEAIAWAEKQLPRGPTATYDALTFGLAQDDVDTIYFLSDGVPTAGRHEERETILAEVRRANRFRRVSIHTIALIVGLSPIESARKYEDPDDMADLMNRIASENQGRFANESKP